MNDLLIFTTAAGLYKVYADLFRFCCNRAYPEYDVEILECDDEQTAYESACIRFLLIPVFSKTKYTYITDIDMMICPETPSLLNFHLNEIKQTGLCYSNVPRWKEPMGENRMTGLHFVTDDWWDKTNNARHYELNRLLNAEIGSCKCEDELMLMRIIKASGLPVTERGHLVSRHHGIHLGTLRDQRDKTLQQRRNAVKSRVSVEKALYWLNLVDTPEYRGIFKEIIKRDLQAVWELRELEKYCRQIAGRP
ncbi:MAG: hypothetical protein IMZ53_01435 [Thermoplasmata archaeon]|nr:hypothetical protein [Thermoplasmata archaeon]MBE3139225.1 hypothetical protein [Thermoplasmata archaeon]